MDIEGAGENLVKSFVLQGLVRDVADLYHLTQSDLENLDRMEPKSAAGIIEQIDASRSRELWRLVLGLGILHVGEAAAKALAQSFPSLDDLLAAGTNQLADIGDVEEAMAASIVQWHGDPENQQLVERLRTAGLNFKSSPLSSTSLRGHF